MATPNNTAFWQAKIDCNRERDRQNTELLRANGWQVITLWACKLTKQQRDIQYTFLFDAKYRIADSPKGGHDVPPVDAIDQMHRYRDAIYYVDQANGKPKREVIGGYVLFPGNYTKEEYAQSYYHQSAEKVGIGAFPLQPTNELSVSPDDNEQALREQIAV